MIFTNERFFNKKYSSWTKNHDLPATLTVVK